MTEIPSPEISNPQHAAVHVALSDILLARGTEADELHYRMEHNGVLYELTNFGANMRGDVFGTGEGTEGKDPYHGLKSHQDALTLYGNVPEELGRGATYLSVVPKTATGGFRVHLRLAGIPEGAMQSDKPVLIRVDSTGADVVGDPQEEIMLTDFLTANGFDMDTLGQW